MDFSKIFNSSDDNLYYGLIIYGLISTIILAVFGTVVGLILGILLAYGKNLKIKQCDAVMIKILKKICLAFCNIYSTIFRGTPMMVQALIFKFGFAAIGINWGEIFYIDNEVGNILNGWLICGLLVITLNTAAYMGEIVKSGLNGVDSGQVEGAKSLGMKASTTSLKVVLPQALRNVLPTIGNELIVNIKDSSVLNVIGVTELYKQINEIGKTTFAYIECYFILAVIYLLLTLLASFVLKLIEKRLDGEKISLNPFRMMRKKRL